MTKEAEPLESENSPLKHDKLNGESNDSQKPIFDKHANEKFPPVKQYYGGLEGIEFDDGANKKILEITVQKSDVVDSIAIWYEDGKYIAHGGKGGFKEQKITFRYDEFVVEATVCMGHYKSYSNLRWEVEEFHIVHDPSFGECYIVHDLIFKTNLGRIMGAGRCKEKEYDERITVTAPKGYGLTGIFGRETNFLNGIGFHWCDVSQYEP